MKSKMQIVLDIIKNHCRLRFNTIENITNDHIVVWSDEPERDDYHPTYLKLENGVFQVTEDGDGFVYDDIIQILHNNEMKYEKSKITFYPKGTKKDAKQLGINPKKWSKIEMGSCIYYSRS